MFLHCNVFQDYRFCRALFWSSAGIFGLQDGSFFGFRTKFLASAGDFWPSAGDFWSSEGDFHEEKKFIPLEVYGGFFKAEW